MSKPRTKDERPHGYMKPWPQVPCGCGAASVMCVHGGEGPGIWMCTPCYERLLVLLGRRQP